jgi:hypothetical protein
MLLKGFMFVHLKKALESLPIDWKACPEPSEPPRVAPLTPYGLNKSVQQQLASIRTDLDSFSETEAYALMVSGYRMTERYLGESLTEWSLPKQRGPWNFLVIEKELEAVEPSPSLAAQLEVAKYIPFKVWRISRPLQCLAGFVSVLLLSGLALYYDAWWSKTLLTLTWGSVAIVALTALIGKILSPSARRLFRYQKTLQDALLGFGMATLGWLVAGLHLHVFDRWFLWQGRVRHLLRQRYPGRVALFTGHLVDAPDRKPPRFPESKAPAVRTQLAARLKALNIKYGFSSAARGADLLFIEELLKQGGTARVILPFSAAAFAKTSVGHGWDDRFRAALENPKVTVRELPTASPSADEEAEAYRHCNHAIQEEALHFAALLGEKPVLVAVWDGNPGAGDGGTAQFIQEWQKTGYDCELINLSEEAIRTS